MKEGEEAASRRQHTSHQAQDHYKRSDSDELYSAKAERNLIQMTVRFRKKTVDTMRSVAEAEGLHLAQAFRLAISVVIEDPENPQELILGILDEIDQNRGNSK